MSVKGKHSYARGSVAVDGHAALDCERWLRRVGEPGDSRVTLGVAEGGANVRVV